MVSWFLLIVHLLLVLRITAGLNISKPNCVDHCGDVKIPYPFGIGANCYYNQSYEIICNASSGSSKPFLREINLELINIIWEQQDIYGPGEVLIVGLPRKNPCESTAIKKVISYDLKGSSYLFSMEDNTLMMEGCGSRAVIKNQTGGILASCASICVGDDFQILNMTGTIDNGDGRCTASISTDIYGYLDYFEIDVAFEQQTNSTSCNASVAFIANDFESNLTGSLSSLATFPTALEWKSKFPLQLCDGGRLENDNCECPQFYEGNPYLANGCQVVQECQNCLANCDYSEDFFNYYCKKLPVFRQASFLAFFIGVGVVLLALGSYWFYRFVKLLKREITTGKTRETDGKIKPILTEFPSVFQFTDGYSVRNQGQLIASVKLLY